MKKVSRSFLIAEFNNTYREWIRVREAGYNRIQFLVGITTAVLGVLGLIIQAMDIRGRNVALFSLIAFLFLCLVAFQTMKLMVSRAIVSDKNIRAIARIRRFFVDNDPAIAKHLTWQTDDSPTRIFLFDSKAGLIRTTQIMLSIFMAGAFSSLAFLVVNQFYVYFPVFFCALFCSYYFLHRASSKRLNKAWDDAVREQRFEKIKVDEETDETAG
jgi:hypothetical protein